MYLPRRLFDSTTQVVYKAAMVEGSTLPGFLVSAKIGNEHLLVSVDDLVSVLGDGVYAVETVSQSKLCECLDAAGLQKFSDDAVRFCHVSLYQDNSSSLLGECYCQRTANDASADNNHIGLVGGHVSQQKLDFKFVWPLK